jgi:hypothetical protein
MIFESCGALDVDPVDRDADLAGVAERPADGAGRGQVEVGVSRDEHRAAAAELHRQWGHAGDGLEQALAGRVGAGERDLRDPGMPGEHRSDVARAVHDVDDARREAGLADALGQQLHRAGRVLRRLDHHRAAGAERAAELPAGQLDGVVPGGDRGDRSDRLLAHHRQELVALVRDRLAADPLGLLGVEAHRLAELAHLAACLVERLAHLERHRDGEIVEPVERDARELAQQGAALEAGRPPPRSERLGGRGHRGADGRLVGPIGDRDHVTARRVTALEAAIPRPELAADERPAVQGRAHGGAPSGINTS